MLRGARKRAGLTQRSLAARAGVPYSTVARIETGAVNPRAATLDALLRGCGEGLEARDHLGVGVDVTLIDEQLRLGPEERLDKLMSMASWLRPLIGVARPVQR